MLLSDDEIASRREELLDKGGYKVPKSQTPWQEIFRNEVGGLSAGMVIERAVKYRGIGGDGDVPRDNH